MADVIVAKRLGKLGVKHEYADEVYSIVDSFDAWRARKAAFDLAALKADVVDVTS